MRWLLLFCLGLLAATPISSATDYSYAWSFDERDEESTTWIERWDARNSGAAADTFRNNVDYLGNDDGTVQASEMEDILDVFEAIAGSNILVNGLRPTLAGVTSDFLHTCLGATHTGNACDLHTIARLGGPSGDTFAISADEAKDDSYAATWDVSVRLAAIITDHTSVQGPTVSSDSRELRGTWAENTRFSVTFQVDAGADDDDNDGTPNRDDRCPGANDRQDADGDGIPNECDGNPNDGPHADADGDGVSNEDDACPGKNDALDADGDGLPDACDDNPSDGPLGDADDDGIPNHEDNCATGDDSQDLDEDGIPNACDQDRDGDGTVDSDDYYPDDADKVEPSGLDRVKDIHFPGASPIVAALAIAAYRRHGRQ